MVGFRALWVLLCAGVCSNRCYGAERASPQSKKVHDYVAKMANQTFREPQGYLRYPYLVPAGPYNQCWDWDSVFMGVAMLDFGSAPYLAGSMKNFFHHTDLANGKVAGCVTPDGSTGTIYHAKPVLIQGAWLVAKYMNDTSQFEEFQPAMEALLSYWDRTRKDNATGLYTWHDQMESGADNLPTSVCPSSLSPSCWVDADVNTLSSADVMTFLYREHLAYASFMKAWGRRPETPDTAPAIKEALNTHLWREDLGIYQAYNVTLKSPILNRVFFMGVPLFGGLADSTQASAVAASLTKTDMLSKYGVRSTSSQDPRYSNANMITPYSNWRGPVWIVANAMLAYGLRAAGHLQLAQDIGSRVVDTLASDLDATGTWHEAYSARTGKGLAAPGFLSWNTLGATLEANLASGYNPFEL